MDKPQRSCFDCWNAVIDGGFPGDRYQPAEPPYVYECKLGLLVGDTDEETAITCLQFNPRLIEKCENCEQKMNTPEWLWPVWVQGIGDRVACCSEYCRSELQTKIDQELKALLQPPIEFDYPEPRP